MKTCQIAASPNDIEAGVDKATRTSAGRTPDTVDHVALPTTGSITPTSPDDDNYDDEYDSPWKDAIEHAFPEFMAFYFPAACAQID